MRIGVYRSFATIARERLIAVGVIIVLMGVSGGINGVVLLVGIDLILLATLIFEHRRIEGRPSNPGDASVHAASAHRQSN